MSDASLPDATPFDEEGVSIAVEWTGEALRLGRGMAERLAGLRPGERLIADLFLPRSKASHNHYFASIAEAWQNIPEWQAAQPWAQNRETLRKHALIMTGYCDVSTTDCGSRAAAERVNALVKAVAKDYVVTAIEGSSLMVCKAQSQKMRAMGKARFQQSKDDVLGWIQANIYARAA